MRASSVCLLGRLRFSGFGSQLSLPGSKNLGALRTLRRDRLSYGASVVGLAPVRHKRHTTLGRWISPYRGHTHEVQRHWPSVVDPSSGRPLTVATLLRPALGRTGWRPKRTGRCFGDAAESQRRSVWQRMQPRSSHPSSWWHATGPAPKMAVRASFRRRGPSRRLTGRRSGSIGRRRIGRQIRCRSKSSRCRSESSKTGRRKHG